MLPDKKFRIILAEDDAPIRESLLELLLAEGFECVACVDGQEARDRLLQEKFDLLITDFHMPRMSGAELLDWCRSQNIHIPTIISTANKYMLPESTLEFTKCCAGVVEKPLDFNQLMSAIENSRTRKISPLCNV